MQAIGLRKPWDPTRPHAEGHFEDHWEPMGPPHLGWNSDLKTHFVSRTASTTKNETIVILFFFLVPRILKPTSLATMTSTIVVFLMRKAMEGGFSGFMRTRTRVLWPHEVFVAIYEFHPRAFAKFILGGGPAQVQEFWRTMPSRRGLESRIGWQRWCVPLGLHGDGVAISNTRGAGSKTIDTLSWTSLLSSAATRFSSYLIYFCFTHIAKRTGLASTWTAF